MNTPPPRLARVRWQTAYRVINSRHPPVDVFERVADPAEWEALLAIETLTNPRVRDAAGEIALVPKDERVAGAGASWIMAAFTHLGRPSRFSDGSYGVYYCARSLETAVIETAFHFGRFLASTNEPLGTTLELRALISKRIDHAFHDLRKGFPELLAPDEYATPQAFASRLRAGGSSGLVYPSVRDRHGECVAAFRPKAIPRPLQGPHLRYYFDGRRISRYFHMGEHAWRELPTLAASSRV